MPNTRKLGTTIPRKTSNEGSTNHLIVSFPPGMRARYAGDDSHDNPIITVEYEGVSFVIFAPDALKLMTLELGDQEADQYIAQCYELYERAILLHNLKVVRSR